MDVLLAVLALLDGKKNRHVEEVKFNLTYSYQALCCPCCAL